MDGDSEEKNDEATSISYLEYKEFKKLFYHQLLSI